ncbi:MAG TPA: sensor domain-containing diguanylate cyclase, partial [Buttiauxella sp.]|nr:sensor domain-containing diguanylate cyclase [Buttiauxella sp.]
ENSNDLIWVMEYPFLTCSYVSPSAERIRGWTAEEIRDQQLDEMVSPDSVRLVQETLQKCMRRISEGDLTGCFFTMELEHLHKDGHLFPVETKGTIMLGSDGRPTHIIGSTRDITERKAAEEAVWNMAFLDQLTGLPNRRMMEEQLDQMLALSQREHRKLSLLFVDLDRFKAVNDQHGHKTGDWLLVQVASRMKSALRASDIASRIGGDEFVILLPDTHKTEDAVLVAEKIRAVLEKPFVMDNGVELDISSSIGVAMYPDQAENVRDLLHFGDEAMYRAKTNGRNAVEVFGHSAQ